MKVMEAINQFREYADKELQQHLAALSVSYQNRKIDKETKLKAVADHRQIYDRELKQRADQLNGAEHNPWLAASLEEVRRIYVSRLKMDDVIAYADHPAHP
jgi:hypothetical protein